MIKGFKDFIFRGNVLDLAVAVVIGAAFSAIITSLVGDVLTPLIGAIVGKPDFSAITAGPVMLGNFINAIVNLLLVGFALYFFVVVPVNRVKARAEKNKPVVAPAAPAGPSEEILLLREIRDALAKR